MKNAKPKFFPTPAHFRSWLVTHHASETELIVGFYKKDSGRPSITWPESVDEALCVGWIDGIRRSHDEISYTVRFTPRKKTSTWSNVNTRRAQELEKAGCMLPAGLAAFRARKKENAGIYSFESRKDAALSPAQLKAIKKVPAAWKYVDSLTPATKKMIAHWIGSAKQEATRAKRLETLIANSAKGEPIPPLRWAKGHGRSRKAGG